MNIFSTSSFSNQWCGSTFKIVISFFQSPGFNLYSSKFFFVMTIVSCYLCHISEDCLGFSIISAQWFVSWGLLLLRATHKDVRLAQSLFLVTLTAHHELSNKLIPSNCIKIHHRNIQRTISDLLPWDFKLKGLKEYFNSYKKARIFYSFFFTFYFQLSLEKSIYQYSHW